MALVSRAMNLWSPAASAYPLCAAKAVDYPLCVATKSDFLRLVSFASRRAAKRVLQRESDNDALPLRKVDRTSIPLSYIRHRW